MKNQCRHSSSYQSADGRWYCARCGVGVDPPSIQGAVPTTINLPWTFYQP